MEERNETSFDAAALEGVERERSIASQRPKAKRYLEAWGDYVRSGRLKSAGHRKGRGGKGGYDEGLAVDLYVSKTAGYWRTLPALKWRYVQGQDSWDGFHPQLPGEPTKKCLKRLRWDHDLPLREAADKQLDLFTLALCEKLLDEPYVSPEPPHDEPDGQQIGYAASGELAAQTGRRTINEDRRPLPKTRVGPRLPYRNKGKLRPRET